MEEKMPKTKLKKKVKSDEKTKIKHSEKVRQEIREIDSRTEFDYLRYAELLHEVWSNDYARMAWGYDDFKSWAAEDLKIGPRKAQYMITIHAAFLSLKNQLPYDRILSIGWTKAKELAKVITKENADEWMERAEELSSRDLAAEVKASTQSEKGNDEKKLHVKLVFSEDQTKVFQDAVEIVKEAEGFKKDADAVAHILLEWIEMKGEQTEAVSTDFLIDWLRRTKGIEVVIVNGKKKKAKK
jgi:hypothetical protein